MARRKRTRAARSPAVKRGPDCRATRGKRRAASRCLSAERWNGEGWCCPQVSPVTRATSGHDAPEPIPDTGARTGTRRRMNDRPRGDGEPGDGTPEFHWLYGGGPTAAAGAGAPRAPARRDPGDARPWRAPPTPAAAARRRRPARPPPLAAAAGPPPTRHRRPTGRGGAAASGSGSASCWCCSLLWVVYLVAVPLWAWTKVDKVEFEPKGDRPDDQPGTTYLMVGSDSRAGLSAKEQRKELGTGNAAGQRTDTIMLLHTGDGPNLLMSIPRDSIVDIPGYGTDQDQRGLRVRRPEAARRRPSSRTPASGSTQYVEIGLGGLAGVVDAVGRHRDLPDLRHEGHARRSWTSRRAARRPTARPRSATPARGTPTSGIGDIDPGQAPARGRLRGRRRGALAVDVHQPVALLAAVRWRSRTSSRSARAWARSAPRGGRWR